MTTDTERQELRRIAEKPAFQVGAFEVQKLQAWAKSQLSSPAPVGEIEEIRKRFAPTIKRLRLVQATSAFQEFTIGDESEARSFANDLDTLLRALSSMQAEVGRLTLDLEAMRKRWLEAENRD